MKKRQVLNSFHKILRNKTIKQTINDDFNCLESKLENPIKEYILILRDYDGYFNYSSNIDNIISMSGLMDTVKNAEFYDYRNQTEVR